MIFRDLSETGEFRFDKWAVISGREKKISFKVCLEIYTIKVSEVILIFRGRLT
tara:strand:+ start:403 stop:561 length:159 start_codon:yes stop_codon:yes gene_type:complete